MMDMTTMMKTDTTTVVTVAMTEKPIGRFIQTGTASGKEILLAQKTFGIARTLNPTQSGTLGGTTANCAVPTGTVRTITDKMLLSNSPQ